MNERELLYAAILATPEDDAPRLVYADYLREQGDAEQAEFIQAMLRLWHDWNAKTLAPADVERDVQTVNRYFAERRTPADIRRLFGDEFGSVENAYWWQSFKHFAPGLRKRSVDWIGGFPDHVEMILEDWLVHGPPLCKAYPLTRVTAVDKSPEMYRSECYWEQVSDAESLDELDSYQLPKRIFEALELGSDEGNQRLYDDADTALRDLSETLIALALKT